MIYKTRIHVLEDLPRSVTLDEIARNSGQDWPSSQNRNETQIHKK